MAQQITFHIWVFLGVFLCFLLFLKLALIQAADKGGNSRTQLAGVKLIKKQEEWKKQKNKNGRWDGKKEGIQKKKVQWGWTDAVICLTGRLFTAMWARTHVLSPWPCSTCPLGCVYTEHVRECVCVYCHLLEKHTHTHTSTFQTCPCATFFCLITGSLCGLSPSGEEERKKKKLTRPGAESYHSQQDVTPIYLSCSCSHADAGVSYYYCGKQSLTCPLPASKSIAAQEK